MSETELSKSIGDGLTAAGFWNIRIPAGEWRVRGGWLHVAEPGTPDRLVLSPYGFLEIKEPDPPRKRASTPKRDKRLKSQRDWHARADREGVRVETVESLGGALGVVYGWREDDREELVAQVERMAREAAG